MGVAGNNKVERMLEYYLTVVRKKNDTVCKKRPLCKKMSRGEKKPFRKN